MKRSFFHSFLSLLLALLLLFPASGLCDAPDPSAGFDIWFLSVGNADATLVICDGQSLLIDGGARESNQYIYSVITRYFFLDHLDYMISTHPDADHLSGLSAAINAVNGHVGRLYWNGTAKETKTYESFVKTITQFSINPLVPRFGDSFTLGSALITFVSPVDDLDSVEFNDYSLVPLITYGDTAFLIAADMGWAAENALLSHKDLDLDVDVLRVAHHGGTGSTGYQFLCRTTPAVAVISTGDNKYGHPTQVVLGLLEEAGCTIYRTDLNGTVHCRSDGTSLTFLFNEGL